MTPISDVVILDNYKVHIELSNGNSVILDFSKKLNTIRFVKLKNIDIFKKVQSDGYSISWMNGRIRVSLGEIFEMLQNLNTLYRAI